MPSATSRILHQTSWSIKTLLWRFRLLSKWNKLNYGIKWGIQKTKKQNKKRSTFSKMCNMHFSTRLFKTQNLRISSLSIQECEWELNWPHFTLKFDFDRNLNQNERKMKLLICNTKKFKTCNAFWEIKCSFTSHQLLTREQRQIGCEASGLLKII